MRRATDRRLRRVPGALLCVVVLLSLALREWYPFSFFPMYASFGPATWHVLVTDGDDHVAPTALLFGIDARPFKRMWERRMLAYVAAGRPGAEAEALAAQDLLREAAARPVPDAPPAPARLRLWMITSGVGAGGLTRQQRLLGEVALR
ncbi:MAG: hypothetical protein SF182_27525 [Deltaproteobacteria bacterium]|nr:hypothetical protein [Deltaproteobacteria bacterium]